MNALALFQSGRLQEAIEALGVELRKDPLDAKRRTFLFELLCFAGEYARAEKQLDVLAGAGADAAAGTLLYRSALHAEQQRRQMFQEGVPPLQSAPEPVPASLNGGREEPTIDADPRIGAHLEVFIAGSYTWIPYRYLDSVETAPPKRLRDLLWMPAKVRVTPAFRLQELGEVLLPVLAPGSAASDDDAVRLGRRTVWAEDAAYGAVPLGQKLVAAGDEDVPLLEVRSLRWNHAAEEMRVASA